MRRAAVQLIGAVLMTLLSPNRSEGQTAKATEWETGCQSGSPKACYELAKAYRRGEEGLARDPSRSAHFYQLACDGGMAAVCQEYGEALLTSADGFARDTVASKVLARACRLDPGGRLGKTLVFGGRRRCQPITEIYLRRRPESRRDSVEIKKQLLPTMIIACSRGGVAEACPLVSRWQTFPDSLLADGPKRPTVVDSLHVADSSRAGPGPGALDSLRRIDSLARDNEARLARLDQLRRTSLGSDCKAGSAVACAELAGMLLEGRGGPRDPAQAASYRRQACDLGDRKSC